MFPFWKNLQIRSAPSSTSIPTKQYIDNKVTRIPMAMPFKSQNMSQGSTLANARQVYRKDSGGGRNWYSGSDVTYMRKITAIGKNAKTIKPWINHTTQGAVVEPAALSTAGQDRNITKSRLQRCRSRGPVAPPKKGFIGNRFKSGGGCC